MTALPAGTRLLPGGHRLLVVPEGPALARRAARLMAETLAAAVARDGRAVAGLSGGGTPAPAYRLFSRLWAGAPGLVLVQVDERLVPPDHPDSNAAMIRRVWSGPPPLVPMVPPGSGAGPRPEALAAAYALTLRRLSAPGPVPRLHLVVLGLGEDGHTASLFPGRTGRPGGGAWVLAVPGPEAGSAGDSPAVPRLTLGPDVLQAAALRLFLVSGAAKSTALRRALTEPGAELPAQRVARAHPAASLWLVDRAAASQIDL